MADSETQTQMWFFWVIATLAKCSVVFSFFQIFDFGWECPIEGVVGESFGVWKPTKNKFHSFSPPKGTGRREGTSFGTLDIKIGLSVWTVQVSKDLKGNLSIYQSIRFKMSQKPHISPFSRDYPSEPIPTKVGTSTYSADVVNSDNFDCNRSTGFLYRVDQK